MSRYVRAELPSTTTAELPAVLESLGLAFEVASEGERIMLDGSLECAGEPVDVRLAPGVHGTVEDFGFRCESNRVALVCGEYDRTRLEAELLPAVARATALLRTREVADREGLEVEEQVEPDGTRRLLLKPR